MEILSGDLTKEKSEYTGGMADLLDTTAKGKTRLYLSKYTAIMIVTVAVTVLFLLSELLYSNLKYGYEGEQYSHDNAIYNMHGAYEIIDNSIYIFFQFDNNRLLMTDKCYSLISERVIDV